jgi:LysM repeat protein
MARYGTEAGAGKWVLPAVIALIIVGIVIVFIFINPFKKSPASPVVSPLGETAADAGRAVPPLPVQSATGQAPTEPNLPKPTQIESSAGTAADKLISDALALINAQPPLVIEARGKLNDVLAMPLTPEQQKMVKEQLAALADKWLFGKTIFAEDKLCGSYKVKAGDRLMTIAEQYKVPYEILMQINGIPKPEALQAGATIKVINGPFQAKIYRSAFTLDLYLQNTFVKSFKIGIGKPGRETPKGLWIVRSGGKMIRPRWTDPDTGKTYESDDLDYPLGSRWIGLEGVEGDAKGREGFAIHGTKIPEEIGGATSRGCIRMFNGEVILMYNLLVPTYSKVEVVD